ncbi:MAG: histidine kinase [Acidobacteriia bacterium]|nr:histidine kinase [Terriglobia bacterium]
MLRRWLTRQAVTFLLWSLFAVYMALQEHYTALIVGKPMTWSYTIRAEFIYAYLWALLTPLILWLADRFPVDQHGWYRMAPVHVVSCLALTSIQRSALVLLHPPMSKEWRVHDFASLVRIIIVSLDYGVMLYGIVLLVHYALKYYARYQEGRVKSSQLETRLAQAQLQALKMQLQPHFLFNTLHSIATLVPEDPEAAETMIARLSELLRLSLENNGVQKVPLSKELEFIESYLGIEQIRFEDRMTVKFDIDPETLDAEVPNLILQPLVENAIHHGIGGGSGGRIEIRSRYSEGKLILQVLDDGPGLNDENPSSPSGTGLGLANTRARLETIYGKEHDFVVRSASNGGVEAAILIPFKPQTQPTSHDRNCKN